MERAAAPASGQGLKIACIGGGPAGLYFAILMKASGAAREVTVFEQNRADATFGWGVVFSDAALATLADADPVSHAAIAASVRRWDRIDIRFKGTVTRSGGHGFAGIGRQRLLAILQERAAGLGVRLVFEHAASEADCAGCDLAVAADGVRSRIRERHAADFRPTAALRRNRYLWLGARRPLTAFTFDFRDTPWGWFQLHAYPYAPQESTFIVETREETWRAAGLDRASNSDSLAFCERLFADILQGERLMVNPLEERGCTWLNFLELSCERWYRGNVVLMGDAVRTAHFSIGSGTRLALDDAIVLARALRSGASIAEALAGYQAQRERDARRLRGAARNRMEWFENVARYARLDPPQFAESLLTGSQRLGHAELGRRDRSYAEGFDAWFARRSGAEGTPPPMFTPLRLRGLRLANRVVVSPMAMYACVAGVPGDFHLAHLGARALGGAGLVMTEMTCVAPEARITPACAGLWNDDQVRAWRRIVDFVHAHCGAAVGLQLGHAGPKGATRVPFDGETRPLDGGAWPLIAASGLPYAPGFQTPRAMTREDMDRVREQFVAAARRGAEAGFDLLELHCAHGYLLASFLSPLTNRREDEYGGCMGNRCRFPAEVLRALRAVWPGERPLAVRISAHDWAPGGNTGDEAVEIARCLVAAGADLIDVSSGNTTPASQPRYGRMYQTPFSDRIRNELGVATVAVGSITEPDQVNTIVAAGRADLCALGRPHLADPAWTLRAAALLGWAGAPWPAAYRAGRAQFERQLSPTDPPPS